MSSQTGMSPLPDGSNQIRVAKPTDADAITRIINYAFRIAESFFIEGDRTSVEKIRAMFATGAFLLSEEVGRVAGCVYVELRGERAYFGLLAVDPSMQRGGTGRKLIAAAEDYARAAGCRFMDLRTVNVRAELPPLYRRLGYVETGTEPFAADEQAKMPCHFVVMSKQL